MNYYNSIDKCNKRTFFTFSSKGWNYLLGVVFLLPCFFSCGEDEIKMTPKIKMHIDTTYRNEVRVLAPELDSICDLQFDDLVRAAKDSIMVIRLKERKEILGQ